MSSLPHQTIIALLLIVSYLWPEFASAQLSIIRLNFQFHYDFYILKALGNWRMFYSVLCT